jgi:hypothetical protein
MFLLSLTDNDDISGLKAKGILEYFYNFTFDDGYAVSTLQSYSGYESEAKKAEFTTSVAEQRKNLLNISPNPVGNILHVEYNNVNRYGNHGNIRIYSAQGQLMYQYTVEKQHEELDIDVSKWNSGVYFCRFFTSKDKYELITFIKQ